VIKVSALYPQPEGRRFDTDYDCATHMPLAQKLLAPSIKGIAVEQGICGNRPDSPPTYAAIGASFIRVSEGISGLRAQCDRAGGRHPELHQCAAHDSDQQVKI